VSAVISVEGATVRAGGGIILSVDSLEVERGELLGVVGPNGAGKSTLLRLLAGFVRSCSGSVSMLGRELSTMTQWQLSDLRRRVATVPQVAELGPYSPCTAAEVVAMGRYGMRGLLRTETHEDRGAAELWLTRLGLSHCAGRPFRHLSGGERRKVLIARAMAQGPQVLLLDEPAAGLDLDWRERLVGLVDELYREGRMTVVVVCHETELLPQSAKRVALIAGGRLAMCGPREEVLTEDRLSAAYGCPVSVVRRGGRVYALGTGVETGGRGGRG